ncbi:MAG: hypothetical protein L0207_02475 [Chlamydiae bacterium]|nr:hypothetical protein [Chlamydiota bacterium]
MATTTPIEDLFRIIRDEVKTYTRNTGIEETRIMLMIGAIYEESKNPDVKEGSILLKDIGVYEQHDPFIVSIAKRKLGIVIEPNIVISSPISNMIIREPGFILKAKYRSYKEKVGSHWSRSIFWKVVDWLMSS